MSLHLSELVVSITLLTPKAIRHPPTANILSTTILLVGTAAGTLSYLSKAQFLPEGILIAGTLALHVIRKAPHILLLITQAMAQVLAMKRLPTAILRVGTACGVLS